MHTDGRGLTGVEHVPTAGSSPAEASGIGLLGERSLHAGLKQYLVQPGDQLEVGLDRFVIDIVRGELLIEIQTRHLYSQRPKLRRLLQEHQVRVVHPLPKDRWIVREDRDGRRISRRKSPKHAGMPDVFGELVRVADLVAHPNLTLEVLLIDEEQLWRDDGMGSWRRQKWSLADRRLLGVQESAVFEVAADYAALLPQLPATFTNAELAKMPGWRPRLAGQATYALRAMGMLEVEGKQGRSNLFRRIGGE